MRRIAAVVPNVLDTSPGQRARSECWARHLPDYGWTVDFYPFEDEVLHEVLYKPGRTLAKASRLVSCYRRQLRRVRDGFPCDVLLLYREAALIGPAWIERLIRRIGTPIVYDIDDPCFVPYRSPANQWFSLLKFSRKTHSLFRLADHVTAINELIGCYAARFNPSVSVIPNFVDTNRFLPSPEPGDDVVRLVWTGSLSTMQNLGSILGPLARLQRDRRAPLRVVGAGAAELPGIVVEARQWSPATEVADLQGCAVGLVPAKDMPWNRWKFFLKAVQYMAVGLPVVAQAMGSNRDVIQDGVNGFVVETEDEWYDRLSLLIEDGPLRRRMGLAARQTALARYSVEAQMPRVAAAFDAALAR